MFLFVNQYVAKNQQIFRKSHHKLDKSGENSKFVEFFQQNLLFSQLSYL